MLLMVDWVITIQGSNFSCAILLWDFQHDGEHNVDVFPEVKQTYDKKKNNDKD